MDMNTVGGKSNVGGEHRCSKITTNVGVESRCSVCQYICVCVCVCQRQRVGRFEPPSVSAVMLYAVFSL